MSWSVSFIGKPEKVAAALDKFANDWQPDGLSRREYEAAKPHLMGLVSQVKGDGKMVSISASGHATERDGQIVESNVSVKIDQVYGALVE